MKKLVYAASVIILVACVSVRLYAAMTEKEAMVVSVKGDVKVISGRSEVGVPCEKGMILKPSDWVKTGVNSSVVIAFDKEFQNAVTVGEDSLMIVKLDGYFKIQLLKGKIYAILENVQNGEMFRVLTPSVATESASSGWTTTADGMYTTTVVVDGEAYVCGVNKDGTVKKNCYPVKRGSGRTGKIDEDPGSEFKAPDDALVWFKEKVAEHHLNQVLAQKMQEESVRAAAEKAEKARGPETAAADGASRTGGKNVFIVDGKEYDLLEYLYHGRLKETGKK